MFHQQGGEPRTSSPIKAVESQEALKDLCTGQPVSEFSARQGQWSLCQWCRDLGHGYWQHLLCQWWAAQGARVVSRCQFKPHQWLWVPDLQTLCWSHASSACVTEEGVEEVISSPSSLVIAPLAIGLDAMLQAVAFPADITDLDPNLAKVDGDAVMHGGYRSAGTDNRSRHQVPTS